MEKNVFMIIDDDEEDRFFFKEIVLAKIFHSAICLEAYDGKDALLQLRKAKLLPNFIFLDVNMPRMDGHACLKELKRDEKLKHIPVIMYSTSFSKESITEFYKLGALSHIIKPTDMNKLRPQILEAMKKSKSFIE